MTEQEKSKLEENVIIAIKRVYDPEIPINIFEMGLIYAIHIDDQRNVVVDMTLTSPNCPEAESIPSQVEHEVSVVPGVTSAKINLTFDPPWNKDMMSEEAKLELGFM